MKITLVLHNIRSVYNVGAILRTAEGIGVEKVVYSGYTPRYEGARLLPHLREKLNRQIEKAALGAEKIVPQVSLEGDRSAERGSGDGGAGETEVMSDSAGDDAKMLLTFLEKCAIMEGYTLVGLENNLDAEEMPRQVVLGQKVTAGGEKVDFGERMVLVLGEEVHGIPAEIREKMDYFLEIPMRGRKESFNVSVATGMALWGLSNLY